MSVSRQNRLVVATLIILPFVVFAWPLFTGKTFWLSDSIVYFYPLRSLLREMTEGGGLFFWNPYIFSGIPLAGNAQEGMFYPLNVGGYLLPIPLSLTLYALVHLAIAGTFTFFWLRTLGIRPLGAAAGALFLDLCPFIVANFPRPNIVGVCAWLPVLLFAFERYLRDGRGKWVALASVAVGMHMLAGSPQMALFDLTFFALYALTRPLWGGVERPVRALLVGALAPAVVGLLIGALQILPFLELAQHNPRTRVDAPGFAGYLAVSVGEVFQNCVLAVTRPTRDSLPGDESDAEPWLGLVPVVLALGALVARPHRREVVIGLLMFIFVCLCLGSRGPTGDLIGHLPGFKMLRFPIRFLFPVTICVALLAAVAIERLSVTRRGCMVAAFLLAVMAMELVYCDLAQGRVRRATLFEQRPEAFARMTEGRMTTMPGTQFHYANAGMVWRVSNLIGIDASPMYDYFVYLYFNDVHRMPDAGAIVQGISYAYCLPIENPRTAMMKLLDLRWIVEKGEDGQPAAVPTGNDLPHAFLAARVREVPLDQHMAALCEPSFDPRRDIVLEQRPPGVVDGETDPGTVTSAGPRWPDTLDYAVEATRPSVLFVSEIFFPGWEVEVDGALAPMLRANAIFRAVAVGPGHHTVHFAYRPSSVRYGAWLSLVGVLLALALTRLNPRKSVPLD